MIYVIEDSYAGGRQIQELRQQFDDPGLLDLNAVTLDGAKATIDDLIASADALPFLAAKRLVIVRRFLGRYDARGRDGAGERRSREDPEPLIAFLHRLPPTTDLVFVESEISPTNPIVKAATALGATIVQQPQLQGVALEDWLIERAKEIGARLTPEGASALANVGDRDSRSLVVEIEKLATYAGDDPITADDVRLLVPEAHEVAIFAFTDALSTRNRRAAMRTLRALQANGAAFPYLVVMIARQLRLLWRARELADARYDVTRIAAELKLPPRVARDLLQQARRLATPEIAAAYRRLVDLDAAFKTGRLSADAALDLFVVEFTRP